MNKNMINYKICKACNGLGELKLDLETFQEYYDYPNLFDPRNYAKLVTVLINNGFRLEISQNITYILVHNKDTKFCLSLDTNLQEALLRCLKEPYSLNKSIERCRIKIIKSLKKAKWY